MNKDKKPRNKRLLKKAEHVGGAMVESDVSIIDGPKLNRHGLALTDM